MFTMECQSCLTSEMSGEEETAQNWHLCKAEVVKWSRAGSQPVTVETRTQREKNQLSSVKDFTKEKLLFVFAGVIISFLVFRWCLLLPTLPLWRRRYTEASPVSASTPSVPWTPRQHSLPRCPLTALHMARLLLSQSHWFTWLTPAPLLKVGVPSVTWRSPLFLYFIDTRGGSSFRALTAFCVSLTAFCQQPLCLSLVWRAASPCTAS